MESVGLLFKYLKHFLVPSLDSASRSRDLVILVHCGLAPLYHDNHPGCSQPWWSCQAHWPMSRGQCGLPKCHPSSCRPIEGQVIVKNELGHVFLRYLEGKFFINSLCTKQGKGKTRIDSKTERQKGKWISFGVWDRAFIAPLPVAQGWMARPLKFNIIVFSWLKRTVFIVYYPAENCCDCRLLCFRSGMNLANLSTRMEMWSAEVKCCKLSVLQAFFKGLRERQASQNEPKKGRC